MALQGDLSSFALPDVLRLLAGTAKTGRLVVSGPASDGEVWLLDGDLVGGSVAAAPHADRPADLLFELLRFDAGSFVFDDGEQSADGGERSSVDDAIGAAEALVVEWAEVEALVPSVHAWISLSAELPSKETTISATQWRTLAAIAGGSTVRALGDRFVQTDLAVSRQVMGLLESGLVELGEAPVAAAPAEVSALGSTLPVADALAHDLALLSAEDGPVVLETRDDALLPEPLPGVGTTFVGELDALGTVDGRSSEAMEAETNGFGPLTSAPMSEAESWDAHEAFAASLEQPAAVDPELHDETYEPLHPWAEAPAVEPTTDFSTNFASAFTAAEAAALTEADDLEGDEGVDETTKPAEHDRGSLRKFLSTVKP